MVGMPNGRPVDRFARLRTLGRESAKVPRWPSSGTDLPAPRSGFYIANGFTKRSSRGGLEGPEVRNKVFDLSTKRELTNGFGNALTTAVELAVTPALMALIGWYVDRWLGTSPAFFLFLFVFTLGYVSWREYTQYQARMEQQEQQLLGTETDRRAA